MNTIFPEIKKKLGFGCMRLPMLDKEVDIPSFCRMVDCFMEAGFNYFDTARPYLSEQSESAVRAALTSRYPRESFVLTDKLSGNFFDKPEDLRPLFESQLEACGVDYLDFYLMHAQNEKSYKKYTDCGAYEFAYQLKREGKVKHVGMSFHDTPEVLDMILTHEPQIELVQLQFNYLDSDNPRVQSLKCYEVCLKHGKPVSVMEPVKGGKLAQLPAEAARVLDELKGGSHASYAVRYAASFDNIAVVLSGMSTEEQMNDNVSFMRDFKPLNELEMQAVQKVHDIYTSLDLIPCTACRYCVDGCPKQIPIPDIFSCVNNKRRYQDWQTNVGYNKFTENCGKASDCIGCGQCESICPQSLPIRELLKQAAKVFDVSDE